MGCILSFLCNSLRPQTIYFDQRARRKAIEILRDTFKITEVQGLIIKLNKKTNKYTRIESPKKICIFVDPQDPEIINKEYYNVRLKRHPEFNGKIEFASAAKLAFIAIKGYVVRNWELEHVCHHHNCINPNHHNFVTKADNLKRKACQCEPHELKKRDNKGRFVKAQRTHVDASDSCPFEPKCIFNLVQSIAKHWKDPGRRTIYKEVIGESLPDVRMSPFW